MKNNRNQTWLFAFTDLAFLLLISLSLIPSAPDNINVHFSEMEIPDVPSNPNMSPVEESSDAWELQVHPQSKNHPKPYRLVRFGPQKKAAKKLYSKHIDRYDLISELKALKEISGRPMLLPAKTSLSQDFLFAAGAVARVWSSTKGQTIVKPIDPEKLHQK